MAGLDVAATRSGWGDRSFNKLDPIIINGWLRVCLDPIL
jgi:hypothetical protein